jgi:hypothetical protein
MTSALKPIGEGTSSSVRWGRFPGGRRVVAGPEGGLRPPAGLALRIVEKVLTGERSCSAGLALPASALALISAG